MKKVVSVMFALVLMLNVSFGYTLTITYNGEITTREVEANEVVTFGLSSREEANYVVDSNNAILGVYGNRRQFVMPAGNVNITIGNQDEEEVTYTVSFNTDGGSTETDITVTYRSTYGELPTPTKPGYNFAGWYNDGSYSTQIISTTTVETPSDHTLYANWIPNTYVIEYNANEGEGTTVSSTHTYDIESALTVNGFTKSGHAFKSWNTVADGSGISYMNGQSVLNLTETANDTIILYAQWYVPFSEVAEVGDYVSYTPVEKTIDLEALTGIAHTTNFNTADTTEWRVLSVNKETGLVEIVSEDIVGRLTLSTSDNKTQTKKSYANAIYILNEISRQYATGVGIGRGRGLGYNGTSVEKIDTDTYELTYAATGGKVGFVNGEPYTDSYLSSDLTTLVNNDMLHSSGYVWLASRNWRMRNNYAEFAVRYMILSGTMNYSYMFDENSTTGYVSAQSRAYGVRPVIILNPDITATGAGTSAEPWTIPTPVTVEAMQVGDYVEYHPPVANTCDLTAITGLSQNALTPSATTAWRVLTNDGEKVELVSADIVGTLTLGVDAKTTDGGETFEVGSAEALELSKTHYANVVQILRQISETYIDGEIAISGRGLGWNGTDAETIPLENISWEYFENENPGDYGDCPGQKIQDEDTLNLLNMWGSSWLGSRWMRVLLNDSYTGVGGVLLAVNGADNCCLDIAPLEVESCANTSGIRPVITLQLGTVVTPIGTEGNSWKLN